MLKEVITTLQQLKEKNAAASLLTTFGKYASTFYQHDELASLYFKLKLYLPAIYHEEHALHVATTDEEKYVAIDNLINLYNHANYPEKAMELIEFNEKNNRNSMDNKLEKAFSYFLLNEKDKAEELLLSEVNNSDASDEIKTKIRFNLGTYCLYRDELQKGLRLFLKEGQKLKYWRKATLPFIFWDGVIRPNKTIILYAEAGIGDEIINIRFYKILKDRGMNPIWFTDRADLLKIFNRNGYNTINSLNDIKDFENVYWCYPMELPVHLNLEYKDLWYGPYLKCDEKNNILFDWMKSSNKLKIGIRYQGNPEYDQDLHRSIPLKEIYESVKHIDAEFYSLQRDIGLDELSDFPDIIDMSGYMKTWDDTLSIINNLDLVISSCTSIPHASAAMGKETIVISPISAYYIWSHSLEQSPWYGNNVTLLRQKSPRCWKEPLDKLKIIVDEKLRNMH